MAGWEMGGQERSLLQGSFTPRPGFLGFGENAGGGIWPRDSGKAGGWLIYAIWVLVRCILSRVTGADSSFGGVSLCLVGLPDSQLCGSGTQSQAPGFIQH